MDNQERDRLEQELLQEISEDPVEEVEEETEEAGEGTDALFDWVGAVVTAVLAVVLTFTFFVQVISVDGPSMQPTLYGGDRLLVLNSNFCDVAAGDVVIVEHFNAMLNDRIVKRVIATGGQTVDIDFVNGIVYVDGVALEEDYINEPTYTEEGLRFPVTLGENEVFILGDNRNKSTDSRSSMLGPVDRQYIVGKALFLLVPGPTAATEKIDWSRIGVLR